MPITSEERKEMSLIPYANIVGNVMNLTICTRPDVAYAISVASRYMADPGRGHWAALKWILKYLKGSMKVGLKLEVELGLKRMKFLRDSEILIMLPT